MSRNIVSNRKSNCNVQNLILQSESQTTSPWGTSSVTVTGGFTDPIGGTNAFKVVPTAVNNSHRIIQTVSDISIGNQFVMQTYVKSSGYNYLFLGTGNVNATFTFFNIQNGTVGTISAFHSNPTITSIGSGWYLCKVVVKSAAGNLLRFGSCAADNTNVFIGDGSSGMFVYATQANFGSIISTYVKTTTAAFNNTLSYKSPTVNRIAKSNRILIP